MAAVFFSFCPNDSLQYSIISKTILNVVWKVQCPFFCCCDEIDYVLYFRVFPPPCLLSSLLCVPYLPPKNKKQKQKKRKEMHSSSSRALACWNPSWVSTFGIYGLLFIKKNELRVMLHPIPRSVLSHSFHRLILHKDVPVGLCIIWKVS